MDSIMDIVEGYIKQNTKFKKLNVIKNSHTILALDEDLKDYVSRQTNDKGEEYIERYGMPCIPYGFKVAGIYTMLEESGACLGQGLWNNPRLRLLFDKDLYWADNSTRTDYSTGKSLNGKGINHCSEQVAILAYSKKDSDSLRAKLELDKDGETLVVTEEGFQYIIDRDKNYKIKSTGTTRQRFYKPDGYESVVYINEKHGDSVVTGQETYKITYLDDSNKVKRYDWIYETEVSKIIETLEGEVCETTRQYIECSMENTRKEPNKFEFTCTSMSADYSDSDNHFGGEKYSGHCEVYKKDIPRNYESFAEIYDLFLEKISQSSASADDISEKKNSQAQAAF